MDLFRMIVNLEEHSDDMEKFLLNCFTQFLIPKGRHSHTHTLTLQVKSNVS